MLKIYNSLTKQKEIFKPITAGKVNLYVCGVTVYDYCHLGHARTYVAFDVIYRYLQAKGYEVNYVRNITDIDDKILQRANARNIDFFEIVKQFTQAMHEDFALLNLCKPQHEPTATTYITQMVQQIQNMISTQHAYVASNGDVYFNVRSFKQYGCLAHRDINGLRSGARVEINDVKKDPLDFVLWKLAKPDEPAWPSPWGEGRPGWHTECCVMSNAIFSGTFDIHGGGKDLIFPHHENELAQSESLHAKKFVNVWMHTGFLQINKEKMSKSLGNFFTIRDTLKRYSPEVLRFFLMNSHYRSQLHYSEENLQASSSSLQRLYQALKDLPVINQALTHSDYEIDFMSAMDDDFNTPKAFAILFQLSHEVQRLKLTDLDAAASHGALLKSLGNLIGILQSPPANYLQNGVDSAAVEALIAARNQARLDKNWAQADSIRQQLTDMKIVLEDKDNGTTWKVCG